MSQVILTTLELSELENLIHNSVKKALEAQPMPTTTTEQPERFFNVQEAAEFLGLSVATVYTLVSRKQLPYMKRSKRLYFSRTELTDYLKEGRNKTHAETAQEAEAFLADRKQRKNGGK